MRGLGDLPQADSEIASVLEAMGASVRRTDDGDVVVESGGSLRGGEFDLRNSPDLLPVVTVLGLLASGRTVIRGIAHARLKESDRPAALVEEIRRIGGSAALGDDWLEVEELRSPRDAIVDDHGDHRIFMAFAVASAALGGRFALTRSRSYTKSYPGFIEDMRRLGLEIY